MTSHVLVRHGNAGSCRLREALGFVREGLLRERWLVGDLRPDTALYGLPKEDFGQS